MLRCVLRHSAPGATVGRGGRHYRRENPDGHALSRPAPATVPTLLGPPRHPPPSARARRYLRCAPFHRRLHLSTPELASSPPPIPGSSRGVRRPALPSCPTSLPWNRFPQLPAPGSA